MGRSIAPMWASFAGNGADSRSKRPQGAMLRENLLVSLMHMGCYPRAPSPSILLQPRLLPEKIDHIGLLPGEIGIIYRIVLDWSVK